MSEPTTKLSPVSNIAAPTTELVRVGSPMTTIDDRLAPMASAVAELFSDATDEASVTCWAGIPMTVATARKVHAKEAQRAYRAWLLASGLVR